MTKYRNEPGYSYDRTAKRWKKIDTEGNVTPEPKGKAPWEGHHKFNFSRKTKEVIPVDDMHAQHVPEGETFEDQIRGFYDAKHNAIGLRTPYVEGFDKYGWDEDTRAKAFDMQYDVADYLMAIDPDLKIAINVGNPDLDAGEKFNYKALKQWNPDKIIKATPPRKKVVSYIDISPGVRKRLIKELHILAGRPQVLPSAKDIVGVYNLDLAFNK